MDNSQDVLKIIQNPLCWVIAAWIARELWRSYKSSIKASKSLIDEVKHEFTDALKDNTVELNRLTVTMTRLEVIVQKLDESVDILPKLKADIDVLHERVRQLRS